MDDPRAADHLSLGLNLAISKPMVFAPVIIGGLISSIIEGWGQQPINQTGDTPFVFFGVVISLIGAVINFIR